ncbi:MAG: hypothetical protein RJA07_2100 [Bacteroidota bacterium]
MMLVILIIVALVIGLTILQSNENPVNDISRTIKFCSLKFKRWMKRGTNNNWFLTIAILFFAALFYLFPNYANEGRYSTFVLLTIPFSIGILFALILTAEKEKSLGKLCKYALIPIAALFIALCIMAGEGIICLIIYSPIILAPFYFGIIIGFIIQSKIFIRHLSILVLLLLNVAASSSHVNVSSDKIITNEIIINASSTEVWNKITHHFSFGESNNFFFKNGVSYPLEMNLQNGLQCKNLLCRYNNGDIKAKVLSCDSLHLLRFTILDSLASMKETSVYQDSRTMHIYNHFFINYGEFKIVPINNHQVKLYASTSFKHKFNPEIYANLWLNYFIQNLHQHVLENMKKQCEEKN